MAGIDAGFIYPRVDEADGGQLQGPYLSSFSQDDKSTPVNSNAGYA